MKLTTAVTVLFATTAATASSKINDENEQLANIDRELLGAPRIINGVDAPEGRYPYTVSLDTGSYHFCGGSLIAPNVVLSAAHCYEPLDKSATRAIVNPYKLSDASSDETFEIESFVKHPSYQSLGGYDHDYVVIKLKGTSNNPYVRLNSDKSVPAVGSTLDVMGWGNTALSGYTGSDTLQQVDVLAMSNSACETKYAAAGVPGQIFDDSLCVAEVNQGSCQGDSGGPLVLPDAGDYSFDVQVGVVSWGIGCAMEERKLSLCVLVGFWHVNHEWNQSNCLLSTLQCNRSWCVFSSL
jgi:secreted trypsin-like serine protease